ncbi:P-loop NTPase fold protein [Streptomyces hoynatensis]|uniref:P-loop NTPase fold protein n=1 Tax=Streptomyces hoynatensis TaxID=1141874 RepID=UPI001F4E1C6A|nr:P-loop NTPase fold protein [Streptomyces hoynatensis]
MASGELGFSLLNDEPVPAVDADLLGAGGVAQELAALLLASRQATPFTLAVDAGWGMGKSSLMRMMDAELTRAEGVHTVWYNAWTSTGADALEGLIKSVLTRFDRRLLRRALARLAGQGALARAARASSVLAAGPFGVAGLVDQLWRSLSASPEARNEMREALRDLTQEWSPPGPGDSRRLLVVFVDDLDRCAEETVLAVCEAVKVYLDVPGLAFVVGCDRTALAPGGLLRELSPAGTAFMEKIFQTSYRVPAPANREVRAFVRHCARQSGIHSLLNADLVSLVAARSEGNPRRIKRLINGLVLEMRLNPLWQDFGPRAADAAVRTLLLQTLYPGFYRMLAGPGAVHGDVLAEFRTYRRVRRVLLRLPEGSPGEVDVARFLTEHEVPPPAGDDPAESAAALERLEAQLPSGFPELAVDQDFTSLVEDLMDLPRAGELIRLLRRQAPPPSSGLGGGHFPGHLPHGPEGEERTARDAPLAGLRVLWIDDNPSSVEGEALELRRAGALVAVVRNRAEAMMHLAAGPRDLLVSDITRDGDKEAGFLDVARLREDGHYTGPVIFYTGRVTPWREARAAALGALGITADPDVLQRLALAAGRRPTR